MVRKHKPEEIIGKLREAEGAVNLIATRLRLVHE